MKLFGSAENIASDVSDARERIERMADNVERATTVALGVFLLVGIVASLALVIAVTREA